MERLVLAQHSTLWNPSWRPSHLISLVLLLDGTDVVPLDLTGIVLDPTFEPYSFRNKNLWTWGAYMKCQ